MEPRGCWVKFAVLGKDCCLLFIFLFHSPPYTEPWPPLSSASVCVTPQHWRLPVSSTLYLRTEPTDCTFSDCKAPFRMGSGSGSRHSVGLAGGGEPWHLESRLDSHRYCSSVPCCRLQPCPTKLSPTVGHHGWRTGGREAACCSCLL